MKPERTDACPLCMSTRVRRLPREASFIRIAPTADLVRCRDCGLIRRRPLSLGRVPKRHYDRSFYEAHAMIGAPPPRSLTQILSRIEEALGPGRLLDVGCGLGAFVAHAAARGWTAVGTEISSWAADDASRRCGGRIVQAPAFPLPFRTNSFDAVFLHHVLEHLADPAAALLEIHRVTRPGGRLVVVVPNEFKGLLFWAKMFLPEPGSNRRDLWARVVRGLRNQTPDREVPSSHLFFFETGTLRRLMATTPWRITHLSTRRESPPPESRYPGGALAKKALHALERALGRAPLIELVARKEPDD